MNSRSKTVQATFNQVTEKNTFYSIQSKMVKDIENYNPNVHNPRLRLSLSQIIVKPETSFVNSASRNNDNVSNSSSLIRKKIQDRTFKKLSNQKKNPSTLHRSYSASNDGLFKNLRNLDSETNVDNMVKQCKNGGAKYREEKEGDNVSTDCVNETEMRSAENLLEGVPETGSGRVMYLVKAFEKLSVRDLEDFEGKKVGKVNKKVSSPLDLCMRSESRGSDSRHSFSVESSRGSLSTTTPAGGQRTTTPAGGQRSRHSSAEFSQTSTGRRRKKQLKATSPRPFKLKTEQRGRYKEEEFTKKLQQMLEEEEKLRVPIAQGLPWTIDEPECLIKPPVKENTRPVDLMLHTDSRAVERAEFDHQVSEKMILIEQYNIERERQQKLEEEEEIKRLRKKLVPKAQPMPYFDRPFVPIRSSKKHTITNEPKSSARPQRKESLNGGG